jgi:hypothetical protein
MARYPCQVKVKAHTFTFSARLLREPLYRLPNAEKRAIPQHLMGTAP